MIVGKKVIVCFPPDDERLQNKLFYRLNKYKLFAFNEVEFLTSVREYRFPFLELYSFSFQDYKSGYLDDLEKSIREKCPGSVGKDFKATCLLSTQPQDEVINYINKSHCDLVLCATKSRLDLQNFFHSSFIDNLMRRSTKEILIVK